MKTTAYLALIAALALTTTTTARAETPFLSGGVGEESRTLLEASNNDYNVKLVMIGEGGIYLSAVQVSIVDTKGSEVLSTVTDGPFLMVQLAKGKYKVTATADGHAVKKNISVQEKQAQKTYHLAFPVKDESMNESDVRERLEALGFEINLLIL